MVLTPGDIAGMRDTLATLLPDTGTVYRKTTTIEGGEEVETWAELATVPCRISPIGGGEGGEEAGRLSEETTHLITFAAKVDVAEPDVVVVDTEPYEATAVRKRGSWELSRQVEAKEATDWEEPGS